MVRSLFVLIAATCVASAFAEEIFQRETEDGVVVQLQVTPSQPHGATSRDESGHRLVVLLRDQASGRLIDDASVVAEVAKAGRAGTRWPLEPTRLTVGPAYVAQVPMAGPGTAYRIRLQFRRPGDAETFEMEFPYAHH